MSTSRYASLVLAVVSPFLFTGCLAIAAGAVAGAAASSDDAEDQLEYYIQTEDVSPGTAQAMTEGRIAKGMTQTEVELVMADAHNESSPDKVKDIGNKESKWIYQIRNVAGSAGHYIVVFGKEDLVVRHTAPFSP